MNSSHSTSTSSSGSTTSSGSSSCTDSGSSSTDSDSTTSSDAKPLNSSRTNDNKTKQQIVTRRKSSECKANQQKPNVDSEKTTAKNCSSNGTAGQKQPTKSFAYSSDDETPPTKKPLKRLSTSSNAQTSQRRRSSGPFALTASKLQKTQIDSAATATSTSTPDVKITKGCQGNGKDKQAPSMTSADAEDTVKPSSVSSTVKKLKQETVKPTLRPSNTNSVSDSASAKVKSNQTKRNSGTTQPIRAAAVATTSSTRKKCSDYSEYDSISGTEDETSSSSSETESSENSSYNSKTEKGLGGGVGAKRRTKNRLAETGVKNKNELFDSEEGQSPTKNTRNRKLTRSLSTRRNSKQQIKTSAGTSQQGMGSETDSEPINGIGDAKRSLCKSPAKKSYIGFGATGLSKCSVKKEISNNGYTNMSRAPTPPQLEKRCPVDGCDSSGHLSGNLDRHFLPEACPIYHNMSVSECKERANERNLRSESINKPSTNSNHLDNQKTNTQSSAKHQQTLEQKEFYSKFKESRARFKPMTEVVNCDKVKLEKDCNDEDREPNLIGLVPDYDLQLFRDAQALASEKIEEEVKDLPIGKGIK